MWPIVFQRLASGGLWSGTVATVTVKSRPAARDELEERSQTESDERRSRTKGRERSMGRLPQLRGVLPIERAVGDRGFGYMKGSHPTSPCLPVACCPPLASKLFCLIALMNNCSSEECTAKHPPDAGSCTGRLSVLHRTIDATPSVQAKAYRLQGIKKIIQVVYMRTPKDGMRNRTTSKQNTAHKRRGRNRTRHSTVHITYIQSRRPTVDNQAQPTPHNITQPDALPCQCAIATGGVAEHIRPHRMRGPYACPALRSMISRSGPSSLVNACASSAATLSFGLLASGRSIALTVAARGSRRSKDSSA